jgi:transposase InsO family protein
MGHIGAGPSEHQGNRKISKLRQLYKNEAVSKVAVNPAKYPGDHWHTNASGQIPVSLGRKEYWLKIRDEFSGYSWDYFMSEKSSTTAILKRQLQWIQATGIRVKTVMYDNAKEQMVPLKKMCWVNVVMVEYVAPYTSQKKNENQKDNFQLT